jgi:hypothetical protein
MLPKQIPGYRITFHDWVAINPDDNSKTWMTHYVRETMLQRIDTWGRRNAWWMLPLTVIMQIAAIVLVLISLNN